jgi:ribosome-associated protein
MARPTEPAEILPRPTIDAAQPSKTRRKQRMHALQDLGERLVALDAGRLALLALPERLADAIAQARSIRAHEGRRRQMQYIGKLMREADGEAIAAALDDWATGSVAARAQFAAQERWRDRLLADASALEDFLAAHPRADRAHLADLVIEARAERARGAPPHRYRALFRYVKSVAVDDATA